MDWWQWYLIGFGVTTLFVAFFDGMKIDNVSYGEGIDVASYIICGVIWPISLPYFAIVFFKLLGMRRRARFLREQTRGP